MFKNSDSDPPDGGGTSEDNFIYSSQLMETEDIGLIIKKIPAQNDTKINTSISQMSEQVSSRSSIPQQVPSVSGLTSAATSASIQFSNIENSPSNQALLNTTNSTPNMSSQKFENRFDLSDAGPFIIMLESLNQNIGNLHPMSIGRLLLLEHKELDKFIQSITAAGKNRVKIIFKTAYHANILLSSKIIEQKEIRAYIPQYLTKRLGVIRGVDFSLTDDDIKSMISPLTGQFFTVLDAQRLKRKIIVEGKEPEYKPTGSIKVTFKGQRLPSSISLCKVICTVEPFIHRVVQCFNCLRYGHISKQCKSKVRCDKCGNEHNTTECPSASPPSCIFCKGGHTSTNRTVCPEFQKQKNIKSLMANENISYRDAAKKLDNSFSTAVQSPILCTPEDFPSLYERRKRKKSNTTPKNSFYSVENIHQDHSGNGVCLSTNTKYGVPNTELPKIIEKLVDAFMHLCKNKDLNSTQCETVIKNIFHPIIAAKKTEQHQK